MRILFVQDAPYLPQITGGVEWNTHDLISSFSKYGMTGAVLCRLEPKGWVYFLNRIRSKLFKRLLSPSDKKMGYEVFRAWSPEEALDEVLDCWKPDAVIIQGSTPEIGLKVVAKKIPVAFYFHMLLPQLKAGQEWASLPHFVACSEYLAKEVSSELQVNPTVIRPFVQKDRVMTKVTPKYLLGVGIQPVKGTALILELAARRPEYRFVLIHSWTKDQVGTEQLINKARTLNNITILSPSSDIRTIYKKTKVLLVPSLWPEAWGRVVTEAQTSGIPVLASGSGGLPESVGEGGICLSLEDNVDKWLEELDRLCRDSQHYERMSEKAVRASKREFLQEESIICSLKALFTNQPVIQADKGGKAVSEHDSTVIVEHYLKVGKGGVDLDSPTYSGLPIHSDPENHQEIAKLLSDRVPRGAKILDLATGAGALAKRLIDTGFDLEAADIVCSNFRLLDDVPFYEVNLNDNFGDTIKNRYDAVVASEIIEHIENPRHFIRQAAKLLDNDGLLILTTPNIESSFGLATFLREGHYYLFDEDYYARDGHITPVVSFVLEKGLREAGFTIEALYTIGDCQPEPWWKMRLFIRVLETLRKRGRVNSGASIVAVARKDSSNR